MAKVVLVGSHPVMTQFAALRLSNEGWEVFSAVGPTAGLRLLDEVDDVDAMVLGGPAAWEGRHLLAARLGERSPFAPVVVATSPDAIGAQLLAAMGGAEN